MTIERLKFLQFLHGLMKKVRVVFKQGNSIGVTIPPNWGFVEGDYVIISKENDAIKIQKVVVD